MYFIMFKKTVFCISLVLMLVVFCFTLSDRCFAFSQSCYDLCIPFESDVKKDIIREQKETNIIKNNETKIDVKEKKNKKHDVKCNPSYHFFWLFFWIFIFVLIIIVIYRCIKRKE